MKEIKIKDVIIRRVLINDGLDCYLEKELNKPFRNIKDALVNILFDRILEHEEKIARYEKELEEKDNKIWKLEGGTNGTF